MLGKLRTLKREAAQAAVRTLYPSLRPAFSAFSHLSTRERLVLYHLAVGRQVIVEIGSYLGVSACCFGAALKEQGFGQIYCIDTWVNSGMSEGNRDTFAQFTENTAPFAQHIVPVRGWSTEVASRIPTSIDLLFIDGDHSYEGVKADWLFYKDRLRPGSAVIFHDYVRQGVQSVVAELVSPSATTISALPNMWAGQLSLGKLDAHTVKPAAAPELEIVVPDRSHRS